MAQAMARLSVLRFMRLLPRCSGAATGRGSRPRLGRRARSRHRTFGQWARAGRCRTLRDRVAPCGRGRRMAFLIVLAALVFLMVGAYRGHSVILFAPVAALGAVLLTD